MNRRLYLSETNKKIAGVCGGIGEYFDVDPTLVRLAWILLSLFTAFFGGVLAYIVAWAVIPSRQQDM